MSEARALAAAAVLLAACTAASNPTAADLPAGARYVAMGSSYAAGPGLGEVKPGTPARCARSTVNYATLLAARLNLALDDQGCSGALIAHILGPWGELPAQIDAVTPDTRLVTVTIGGNDLNFVGALFAASCRGAGDPGSCPAPRFPAEVDYSAVERDLTTLVHEVRRRAPQARLVFVQYVRVVPEQVCAATPIDPALAARSRAVEERLFAITARVAADTGAAVLPVDELSRSHTPCDPQPWSNGNPLGYDGAAGAPWHPNAAGMAGIAAALEKLVSQP